MTTELIADTMTLGSGSSVILVSALVLVAFMITKETMTSVPDRRGRAAGKVLDVVVIPLLMVFAMILAVRIVPSVP